MEVTGTYAAVLSFSAIPNLLGNWAERIFDITKNQKLVFKLELFFGTLAVFLVFISTQIAGDVLVVIASLSGIMATYYSVFLYKLFIAAKFKIKTFYKLYSLWALLEYFIFRLF